MSAFRRWRATPSCVQSGRLPMAPSAWGGPRATRSPSSLLTVTDVPCCLIQSVFHSFGAAVLEPKTGFVMHNRGSFFSLSPDSVNQLAPGRRPAHTLMPVMVTHGADLAWVAGTMGGKAQPQILAQVLLRLFAGENARDAVAAPRWVVGGLEVDQVEEVALLEPAITTKARSSIRARLPIGDLHHHEEEL